MSIVPGLACSDMFFRILRDKNSLGKMGKIVVSRIKKAFSRF